MHKNHRYLLCTGLHITSHAVGQASACGCKLRPGLQTKMLLLLLLASHKPPDVLQQYKWTPACPASDTGPRQDSKGKAVDVWTNFREYGLRPPVGLMRADSHLPPFRPGLQEVIDAIICDPPYGVSVLQYLTLGLYLHPASWLQSTSL